MPPRIQRMRVHSRRTVSAVIAPTVRVSESHSRAESD